MCKKLIFLVSFVCMLGLVSAAMAEDLNPPDWAGAEGSWYGIWEFYPDDYIGELAEYEDYWNPTESSGLPEEGWEFCTLYYEGEGEGQEDGGVLWEDYGEGWFWSASPEIWGPEGESKIIRAQFTFEMELDSEWSSFLGVLNDEVYCMFSTEDWFTFEDALEGDIGVEYGELIDAVELGDGLVYICLETEIFTTEGGYEDGWIYFEGDPIGLLKEVVIDFISYSGEELPWGTPPRGVKVVKVSNPQPEDGEEHVDPTTDLCFQAPYNALCMDVNADPNLKGPFEYDVYFSSDPCELVWIPPTIGPTNANDVMCVDPCAGDLLIGTEYFWRVDINDLNSPGDPCFYEGLFRSFITWGYAYDEVPPDGAVDVDTGTIELQWTGDGFVYPPAAGTSYDVYFGDDYDEVDEATVPDSQQDANSYTPAVSLTLGEEYCWRIDEVNVVAVKGHVWCFSTSLCSTWETFEDYADDDEIAAVWVDWRINDTGSFIFLGKSSDDEPVYGGDQSMEYYYDNIYDPFYSESTRTFSPTVDWSPEGIAPGARALRIWFHDTDEDGAGAEQMYVKLESETPHREQTVRFDPDTSVTEEEWTWIEATDEDVLWIGWSIALSDFAPVDLDSVETITIGFDTEDTEGLVFLDTFQLCGSRCIPGQAPWSWNDDCATDWDEWDMIAENWLAMDEYVPVEEPCDANLIVEYLFDNNDLTDTAGVGPYHGIGVNEPNIHDGLMTLDGDDWVIVPIDPSLFQGDKSWTVVMDIVAEDVGVMFGVTREPYGQVGEGGVDGEGFYYDPELCLEDANYCDEGLPPYPYGGYEGTSGLVMFQGLERIVADRFWKGWTEVGGVPPGEGELQVVLIYDAEEPLCQIYADETAGGLMRVDPNVPDPCDDTVTIGYTENRYYPADEEDIFNFIGDIDNFRIYDYALSYGEILGLVYPGEIGTEHAFPLDTDSNVDEQTINYEDHDRQIVNLRDFALMAEHWLEVDLWPPEE